ncbi:uncharacterized protein LOC112572155 [Pomacea canaliculata]|uniref:uncharacterized protein LOC112572155 n=1 Tax=Pomacea canaliculata TaxID=400727 RepID=UPI000D728AC9|nr:uncharacterized protein LOC112572155 [Pomacea canaliculata]
MFKLCLYANIILVCVGMQAHRKNVALNKPCGSSSRHSESESCSGAVNGNDGTFYDPSEPWINCIHTDFNDLKPFWWVDLGQEFTLNTITIYGRASFIKRMKCVNVSVDGKVIKRFDDLSGWTNDTYDIRAAIKGRVINITKDCDSEGTMLNICEVQVWVCNDGWYGNCSMTCGPCADGSVCDKINGKCANCKMGFQPPHCKESKRVSERQREGVKKEVRKTERKSRGRQR